MPDDTPDQPDQQQATLQEPGWSTSQWLPLGLGAGALGLLLAGRAGSPASQLGGGLLGQLAAAYAIAGPERPLSGSRSFSGRRRRTGSGRSRP